MDLLEGWPERTSRVLVALVLAALLIGVPAISLSVLSVHIDRQTMTIAPHSYRSIHLAFYGYGTVDYSYEWSYGEGLYIMQLDWTNYLRFASDRDYQYISYDGVGQGGSGSSSSYMAGFIGDNYFVFVNDGSAPASIKIKFDGTVYFSMIPAAAILVAAGLAGYGLGRIADRTSGLEITDSLKKARDTVRTKALKSVALLSLLSIALMIGVAAAIPGTSGLAMVGDALAFYIALLVTIAIAFQLRFKLAKEVSKPDSLLSSLAYRLRISGYRVTEGARGLVVQVSSTTAVQIMAKRESGRTWVIYRPSATPKGFSLLIILIFLFFGSPFALALAFFMVYKASVFAGSRVYPRLSTASAPQGSQPREDTRAMIVEALSEGRRLSSEAYEAARSNYHDWLAIMIFIGIVVSIVLGTLSYGLTDSWTRGRIALGVGVLSAAVFSTVSWLLLRRRSKARISEFKSWSDKLKSALSREVDGKNPLDHELSSFELIAGSFVEMPKWLRARRKAGGYRKPFHWLLIFFLANGVLTAGLYGVSHLIIHDWSSGVLGTALCVLLILVTVYVYWAWTRQLDRELASTLSEWEKRSEALKSEMERLLSGG